jgi:hypothetical protein
MFDGAPFTAADAQVEYLLPTAPPPEAFTMILKAFEVARGHLPIVRTRHIRPGGVDKDWHSFNHRWRCTHPGCDFDLTADADGNAVDRLFDTFADQGKVSIACIDAMQKKAAKRRGHKRR